MPPLRSGLEENLPYSLSRWTDVSASQKKWDWFVQSLSQKSMMAIDPRTAVPCAWSLDPADTLGLIFWTKDPTNLTDYAGSLLAPYRVKIHHTITGWHEVEKGAPDIHEAIDMLQRAVSAYGPGSVTWRFSPVPLVPDVLPRFELIALAAGAAGLKQVFVSFLQDNDLMPETRPPEERLEIITEMARVAEGCGVSVRLCNEDRLLFHSPKVLPANLGAGVCAPPEDFMQPSRGKSPSEGCGCAFAVDPFTINESCSLGCRYCLDVDTPVLFDDFVWRPLHEVKVGDTLIGFDEEPPGFRKDRKFRRSVVEGVWRFRKPVLRIITESTEVFTTADHLWFEGKTRKSWKRADHLALDCRLHRFDVVHGAKITEDYRAGYIAAMTIGDGTWREAATSRPIQPYWRVALADEEPLLRLRDYLHGFGISAPLRPFDSGSAWTRKLMQKVETRSSSSIQRIVRFFSRRETQEYKLGFLAGAFDAEGSYSGSLRVHQKQDNGFLERVSSYGTSLGLDIPVEGGHFSARVAGGLRQYAKFFSMTRPALLRKTNDFYGRSIDFVRDPIVSIERAGVRDVIDIQTSTRTFLAGGLATHNCYAADKSLSDKKRNTVRRLAVLQGK